MLKQFLLIIYFLLILLSCTPHPPFATDVIMFEKEIYSSTNPDDIEVYTSRLDIPNKYFEIGTIKYQGVPIMEKIKSTAASKGADAVIKDANNFVLIKYKLEQEKEDSNETKTI
jgi:hypothetical protein